MCRKKPSSVYLCVFEVLVWRDRSAEREERDRQTDRQTETDRHTDTQQIVLRAVRKHITSAHDLNIEVDNKMK